MYDTLVEAMIGMNEPAALSTAKELLADDGADPIKILEHCRKAMETVGSRFAEGEYFLPELILAGEMFSQISKMAKRKMDVTLANDGPARGKIILGTVEGDIHDIGKDIVKFMLDTNGFEVIDLGVDVPSEKFIEAVKENSPEVLGLCGLLTLAYTPMKNIIEGLGQAGLRSNIKVMIGGGAMSEEIKKHTGADAYGKDAIAAVSLAKAWTGGKANV